MNLKLLPLVSLLISPLVVAKETYTIARVQSAPVIDGKMDGDEWQKASKVKLAFEIEPGDSTPAKVDTFAYIMEDGEYFYVAFKAFDPEPEKILANMRDRDKIFSDDFVGVVVDPFNDARNGFEFFVNPLGSQGDLTRDDVQNIEDPAWNAVWDSAGQLTDDGFIVEIAVPYRSIRYTADLDIQTWGIQFVRNYPRNVSRLMIDAPSDRKLECTLCQYNKVTGMPNLQSAGVDFDIVPTLTYTNSEARGIGGDWQELSSDSEFGADLRWAMTENWIVNGTINPDFSQVEADVAQLDINTTFSLFFPETRSFFLDGAEYFNSANQLVHSRNIADPEYGVKLTGQTDNLSLGVIASGDQQTSFLLPSSQGSDVAVVNDSSDVLIVRGQYDYGAGNNFGFLLTNRSANDYENSVLSFDGKHHFAPTDILSYQIMYSDSENPLSIQDSEVAQSQSATAYSVEYRHKDENASFKVAHAKFGEDFRADMGFITRVNYRQYDLGYDYTWYNQDDSDWTHWGVSSSWRKIDDLSGTNLEQLVDLSVNLYGPMQLEMALGLNAGEQHFAGVDFDDNAVYVDVSFKPFGSVLLGAYIEKGDQIDFENVQLGDQWLFSTRIDWQVSRYFNVNVQHTLQSLDVSGGELFEANLLDLRLTYQFNSRNKLALTVQESDIHQNLSLYGNDQGRFADYGELGTQLIYSYKVNAKSLVYLGYSDNAVENNSLSSYYKTGRTLFAKFSYMFQS